MCGIVGYIGTQQAAPLLLEGLGADGQLLGRIEPVGPGQRVGRRVGRRR